MSPTTHNRLLGILHLAYGSFSFLAMVVVTISVLVMIASGGANDSATPIGALVFITIGMVLLSLIITIPSLIAGYGLLRRRRWARTLGIMAGIIAALTFPFGTALCVYTLWFFFGERGKFLYHKAAYALPLGPPLLRRAARHAQPDYVPPPSPPDWR